jgi:chromosome segregation ATPase
MKCVFALLLTVGAVNVSPIEKTMQLLDGLIAKITKEGEEEHKLFEDFTAMCHDDSMDLGFQIETGKKDVARAKATIADEEAKIGSAEAKIEELSTSIATSTKDLESATAIRAKENEDFQKLEKELMEAVSMLERAYGIIEREMAKTGFIQGKAGQEAMSKVMDALEAVIVSAGVNSADKVKVQALLQATQGDSDSDLALQPGGAPDPAAYKSKSGGILSVLEDMLEKAKAELASAQKAEMNSAFDFKMLKQKLEDAIAFGEKTLAETKKAKAAAEEAKAVAEGELETASKNLSDDETHLKDLQQECMTSAEEDTESKTSRAEELEALGTAKKILEEKTGAASDRAYSFIQIGTVSKAGTKTKEVKQHVLDLLQSLAKKNNDKQLSLLAQRIQSAAMLGEDPFAKIKGLISEMIEKLEAEAAKEAAHKAFCDKELSETKAKKEDKETELDDLSTKIDKATSKIAKLKEEVATLSKELGEIAAAQKKATEMRNEQAAAWASAKADYEQGLEGVGMALQVLRDYYAEKDESFIQGDKAAFLQGTMGLGANKHSKATGASTGIIGMLEVVESDFSKLLSEGNAAEAMAVEEYEKLTQDNAIATTEKETAVKYKTKDSKETEAMLAGLKEDKEVASKEYSAIMDYWEQLQPMCIAKPEPYAERKKRREAEIAGLKEALTILEEEAGSPAFLQMRPARRA